MGETHGGDIWKASAELGVNAEVILDFSASINPLGLSPKARAAARRAIGLAGAYPEPNCDGLNSLLASFHSVDPAEISCGNGSTEFIYLLPRVFKPERALIVEPAFSEYRNALKLSDCAVDSFVLKEDDGFSLDLGKFEKKARNYYGLAYLGNPSNPTGAALDADTVLKAARILEKRGTTLVVDEAFADFSEDCSVKKEAVKRKNIVVLRSMTKFFSMAGFRLGYIVSNRKTVKAFSKLIPPWSVNTVAAFTAAASLADAGYIARTHRWLVAERDFLCSALKGLKSFTVYPSSANYIMVRINGSGKSASQLRGALYEKGILVRDLSSFKGLGPGYLRFAVRKREENAALVSALKKVFSQQGR